MLEWQDGSWRLSVRGSGGHDLLTLSPVLALGGSEPAAHGSGRPLEVAPIGLVNMMNAGGAVLAAELAQAGRALPPLATALSTFTVPGAHGLATYAWHDSLQALGRMPSCAWTCVAAAASCCTPRAVPPPFT